MGDNDFSYIKFGNIKENDYYLQIEIEKLVFLSEKK